MYVLHLHRHQAPRTVERRGKGQLEAVIRRLTQLAAGLICSTCLARRSFANVSNGHLDNTGWGINPLFSRLCSAWIVTSELKGRMHWRRFVAVLRLVKNWLQRRVAQWQRDDMSVEMSADINQRKSSNAAMVRWLVSANLCHAWIIIFFSSARFF